MAGDDGWFAEDELTYREEAGETPLQAAMRLVVKSKFGPEVEDILAPM